MDSFYHDFGNCDADRVNFDHPDAVDIELLMDSLTQLTETGSCQIPTYDFKSHSRLKSQRRITKSRFLIIEGILLYCFPDLVDILDKKVYIETDSDLRLARRIERDILERGRDVKSIIKQYLNQVKPSYEQFVEPSKSRADFVFSGEKNLNEVVKMFVLYLKA